MQVPTWFRRFLGRYIHGVVPVDGVYIRESSGAPPCSERQRLCSLPKNGPKVADRPGGNIRWINAR